MTVAGAPARAAEREHRTDALSAHGERCDEIPARELWMHDIAAAPSTPLSARPAADSTNADPPRLFARFGCKLSRDRGRWLAAWRWCVWLATQNGQRSGAGLPPRGPPHKAAAMRPTTASSSRRHRRGRVQRANEQMERAWPRPSWRLTEGACDADAALTTFQKCLKAQCPTIIDSRAATLRLPAVNETATSAKQRTTCFQRRLLRVTAIDTPAGTTDLGGGGPRLPTSQGHDLQKRNSLKWVEEDYDDDGCRDARAVVECVWHNGNE